METQTLGRRPHVLRSAWLHKQGVHGSWHRFYFVLTESSLFYYRDKHDPSSLVGYLDRTQVRGVQTCREVVVDGVALVHFQVSVEHGHTWDLASVDPMVKARFCQELTKLQHTDDGVTSPAGANAVREARDTGMAVLTSALSRYESEFDQLLHNADEAKAEHERRERSGSNARAQRLEASLMEMLGDCTGSPALLDSLSPASDMLDGLLDLLDEMVASGETSIIHETVRRAVVSHATATKRLGPACAAHLRNSIVHTFSSARAMRRTGPVNVKTLWHNTSGTPPDSDTLLIDPNTFETIMGALMETAHCDDE